MPYVAVHRRACPCIGVHRRASFQVSGMGVRPILERSGLPVDTLRQAHTYQSHSICVGAGAGAGAGAWLTGGRAVPRGTSRGCDPMCPERLTGATEAATPVLRVVSPSDLPTPTPARVRCGTSPTSTGTVSSTRTSLPWRCTSRESAPLARPCRPRCRQTLSRRARGDRRIGCVRRGMWCVWGGGCSGAGERRTTRQVASGKPGPRLS